MLPHDREEQKKVKVAASAALTQTSLDGQFPPAPPTIRYSDSLLKEAAIDWLVNTNQVGIAVALVRFKLTCHLHSHFMHLRTRSLDKCSISYRRQHKAGSCQIERQPENLSSTSSSTAWLTCEKGSTWDSVDIAQDYWFWERFEGPLGSWPD